MASDRIRESAKLQETIDLLTGSSKDSKVIAYASALIKKLQLLKPAAYEVNVGGLFDRLDLLSDKKVYVMTAHAFLQAFPIDSDVNQVFIGKVFGYLHLLPCDSSTIRLKIDLLFRLSNFKEAFDEVNSKEIIAFLFFDCLLNREVLSSDVLFLIQLFLNNCKSSKAAKAMLEVIIDACVIMMISFKDSNSNMLILVIYNLFGLYLKNAALPKQSVLRNIVIILAYHYQSFIQAGDKQSPKQLEYIKMCLKCHPTRTMRVLLEHLSHFYTFSLVFACIDHWLNDANDSEYAKLKDKYEAFLEENINSIQSFQQKTKTITKGVLLVCGLAFSVSASSLTFASVLLSQMSQLIEKLEGVSFEVMTAIKTLIKKEGCNLIDEWSEIFKVINHITQSSDEWTINPKKKALLLTVNDSILLLLLKGQLCFNPSSVRSFLLNIKTNTSEMLTMIRIKLLLSTTECFEENYHSVLSNYFFHSTSQIKMYILELIRYIYSMESIVINEESSSKSSIIENSIVKYFPVFIKTIEVNESIFAYLSYFIAIIASTSSSMPFIKKLIDTLMHYKPKQKEEGALSFSSQTLLLIYDRIINTYQKDKTRFFHKYFFSSQLFKSGGDNEQQKRFAVLLLDHITINTKNELFLFKASDRQQIVINYNKMSLLDKKSLLTKEEFRQYKQSLYTPYIVLKHNNLYESFLNSVNTAKDAQASLELFKFLEENLKKIYFLQGIGFVNIINDAIKTKTLVGHVSNQEIFIKMISVLVNLAYHLNSGEHRRDEKEDNTLMLGIRSLTLKSQYADCLAGAFEHFLVCVAKVLSEMRRVKNITSEDILIDNITFQEKQINSLMVNFTLSQSAEEKKKAQIQLNFEKTMVNVNKTLSALQFYYSSIMPIDYYAIPNSISFSKAMKSGFKEEFNKESTHKPDITLYKDRLKTLLDSIVNQIWVYHYKLTYAVALLQFLLGAKELIKCLGEQYVLKVVYIALIMGYSQTKVDEAFSQLLGFKPLSEQLSNEEIEELIRERSKSKNNVIKEDFVVSLAEVVLFNYLVYAKSKQTVWSIISEVIPQKDKKGKEVLQFAYWALFIRGKRDSIEDELSFKPTIESNVYLQGDNVIAVTQKSLSRSQMVIRNSMNSLMYTIDYNCRKTPSSLSLSRLLMNQKEETKSNQPSTHQSEGAMHESQEDDTKEGAFLIEGEYNIDLFSYLASNTIKEVSYRNLPQLKYNDQLALIIDKLDNTSIFKKVFFTGVIYRPDIPSDSSFDILSYSSTVSDTYLSFISSLGTLHPITANSRLPVSKDGSDGKYVIYHNDLYHQLIFRISNLIIPDDNADSKAALFERRGKALSKSVIHIVWIDNPLLDFRLQEFFPETYKVFLLIHPISLTHFLIKRLLNEKMLSARVSEVINQLFINNYVINSKNKSSIEYFLNSIICLNRLLHYLLKDSSANATTEGIAYRSEYISSLSSLKR